jgi:FkbM family methyltransferase
MAAEGRTLLVPQAVVLALAAHARGDQDFARAMLEKLEALSDVADSYHHLIRLLADHLAGVMPSTRERDESHPFYQPPRSCQIPGLGALYEQLFGLKRDGVFIEIGAFDGEWLSNTCCLADLGWSGLMIEPNPTSFELCRARHQRNPGVRLINCAIGSTPGLATLFLGESLSTTVAAQVELYRQIPWASSFHTGHSTEVTLLRLDSLLETSGTAPGFDLLAIDVEGAELNVMRSFDLGYWLPRAVIIELTDINQGFADDPRTIRDCAEIRAQFHALGYSIRFADHGNTIFARD